MPKPSKYYGNGQKRDGSNMHWVVKTPDGTLRCRTSRVTDGVLVTGELHGQAHTLKFPGSPFGHGAEQDNQVRQYLGRLLYQQLRPRAEKAPAG